MKIMCPHCGEDVVIPSRALANASTYRNRVITTLTCCNRAIEVVPLTSFAFNMYKGDRDEDDWGNEINREPVSSSVAEIVNTPKDIPLSMPPKECDCYYTKFCKSTQLQPGVYCRDK